MNIVFSDSKTLNNLAVVVDGLIIWERWEPVAGYEEFYLISNFGRIKSLEKIVDYVDGKRYKYETKILQRNYSNGYRTISLVRDKTKTTQVIHILVGNHFIDNPESKPFINHIDGDRSNNFYLNLEWSTNSENQLHAYNTLHRQAVRGEKNGIAKLTEEKVIAIRKLRETGKIFKDIAKEFNMSPEAIRKVVDRRSWAHVN